MSCRSSRCDKTPIDPPPSPPPTEPKACVVVRSPRRWQHKPRRPGRYAVHRPASR